MTFEEIYSAHFAFVWRSLRELGIAERDVSDGAQEVFMVVHRKLDTFKNVSPRGWLYAICLRVASDHRRRAHVRLEVAEAEPMSERADTKSNPADHTERAQAFRLLTRALDVLPSEQRAVFSAFELEEMTCDEIANAFEIPVGTVYSRLRLARESFFRALSRFTARDRLTEGTKAL